MDISHWNAAIHYGIQLAQYCDQTLSCNDTLRRSPPCVLPYPMTQEHQSTSVDIWVHRVPEMDISHWDAAIHYGIQLAQYCDQTRSFNVISLRSSPVYSLYPRTQEHQSTCVDSWVHRVPENGHQPLGRGNSLWHSACPILWQTQSCNDTMRRSPPVYSLTLRLRNTKVPVWTHESIGCLKMVISHWHAAIHYGIQLARYCDQNRSFNAISRRSPPVYSLALRLRNTKVPVWTHESIRYLKKRHQPLGRGNSLWRSACPILWSNPIF